jgi:hypothetical protein
VKRFPLIVFVALIGATVAAFFIAQHLKVATPLIAGAPQPDPATINPVAGGTCYDPLDHRDRDYRTTSLTFFLLHESDHVDVYIVTPSGDRVATLARDRFMRVPVPATFTWNGREPGGAVAPDGTYYVAVHLIHQNRTVTIANFDGPVPLTVATTPPRPVVTVAPRVRSRAQPDAVRITFTGDDTLGATVLIYRLARGGSARLVASFAARAGAHAATWDGLLGGRPAAPGVYLIGVRVINAACTTGVFPPSLAPLPAGAARSEVRVLQ